MTFRVGLECAPGGYRYFLDFALTAHYTANAGQRTRLAHALAHAQATHTVRPYTGPRSDYTAITAAGRSSQRLDSRSSGAHGRPCNIAGACWTSHLQLRNETARETDAARGDDVLRTERPIERGGLGLTGDCCTCLP